MEAIVASPNPEIPDSVGFQTAPSRYRHWKLSFEGRIATLAMDVQEDAGIRPGYKLKLNSYDLGVDIELHDALQRIRFEHPEVSSVVLSSAKQRVFCSGANIYMLGLSSHAWKVNFCKFTNETRNGIEDSSAHSSLKFIAACSGSAAGGGYELALACDEIILIDDRSSSVSLPETPLLGVLPGTGGLTRLTDKRRVRRDLADVFCTTPEGIQGQRAKQWGLVDAVVKPQDFDTYVKERARALAQLSDRPTKAKGIELAPIMRSVDQRGYHYRYVDVQLDPQRRVATLTIKAPESAEPALLGEILDAGATWWPLQMSRELDDAILSLRTNQLELGLWLFRTEGDWKNIIAIDSVLLSQKDNWLVREVIGMMRRTFARVDVTSRSIYALVEPGSCFAGSLLELALAADRVYMLDDPQTAIELSEINFGGLEGVHGHSRLEARFHRDQTRIAELRKHAGARLDAQTASQLGLVTFTPDELDWNDEVRLAIETRLALSPDALTGMEANLRFGEHENMDTRIFGRLSAWQNWIFIRPNAVGPLGALKVYGTGNRAKFDWERV
ncbi:MAG TPA: 2,3-epoxybenzoyl-CoA dihydrolase [Candidatus Eremiobacteraceae bacterium]|nr:2,3-epoxybenzoyl-CoA dihydrolase [Candidatus Eremiobacteraceae bacterium]